MQILWLKRDLRLRDHLALQWLLEVGNGFGSILPVYIHEPDLIAAEDFSAQHGAFLRESLDDLGAQIQSLGGRLLEMVGHPTEVFERLLEQAHLTSIVSHQETGHIASFERDIAVKDWCRARNVRWIEVEQNGVLRGKRLKEHGFEFNRFIREECERTVFTPRLIEDRGMFAIPSIYGCQLSDIPVGCGVDKPLRQKGGRTNAKRVFADFMRLEKINGYPSSISSIAKAEINCSRLSPYLALGVVSVGEVIQRLNKIVDLEEQMGTTRSASFAASNARFFLDRLYWRSGYLQALEANISIEWENGIPAFDGVREQELSSEEADRRFHAWSTGHTGYPMIDATMRMLFQTGWINMRSRGMLSSFASNDLWLPWRMTGLHLAREFLDYEPAIHWGQMQIHAGTSRLSRPLSYNPVKQARDHDPDGSFVWKWIPELKNVSSTYIHEPWKMPMSAQRTADCLIGANYPAPIVDISVSSPASKDRVYALRGDLVSQKKGSADRSAGEDSSQGALF